MFAAMFAALGLVLSSSGEDPDQYALTLSVVHDGVETVAARTLLVEDGAATVTVQDATGLFEMSASLSPVQGDGTDELFLHISIVDGDRQVQEPQLILRRGGDARFAIGQQGPDGRTVEGLEVTLSALPD